MLLAAIALARLVYQWVSPLDLIGDESYYWDWGRRPDWGYFSKPPLIGWLYGAVRALGFHSTAGVRWPAVGLGTIGLAAMALLLRRMAGPRAGFWGVVLLAATPGNVALNLLLTIDAPLLAMWALALLALWRALGPRPDRRWWLLYAAAMAVGVLAKQMMLVLPLLALIWLATDRDRRPLLRAPGTWLALWWPCLALAPTVAWNAGHDWVTAHHTAGHLAVTRPFAWKRALLQLAGFSGGQLLLVSPVLGLVWANRAWHIARSWGRATAGERFLWCFSVPPLLVIAGLALRQLPEPNWPAAFWLAGGALACLHLAGDGTTAAVGEGRERVRRRAVRVGLTLAGLVMAVPFLAQLPGVRDSRWDPTRRLRGWHEVAAAVGAVRFAGAADHATPLWPLVVGDRAYASALAFYSVDQPRVYHLPARDSVQSQYELWPDPTQDGRLGSDALIIVVRSDAVPAALAACFARIESAGALPAGLPGQRTATLWIGRELRGWPQTRQP